MNYKYLTTYKAKKTNNEEIEAAIPVILDRPIYQPEVLINVCEEIKERYGYCDVTIVNIEILHMSEEEIKQALNEMEKQEEKEREEYRTISQKLEKTYGQNGLDLLKTVVDLMCECPICVAM